MTQPAPKYGHNAPPNEAEALVENLHERHRAIVERAEELIEAAARVPEKIEDEETAGRTSDFIKQIAACRKTLETTRVGEKEPYLAAGRAVDGYFKKAIDPLDQAKKAVQSRLDVFLRKKADAERKRREEEDRKAREEAERMRREAEAMAAGFSTTEEMDAAIAAQEKAQQAAAQAEKSWRGTTAKAADISRQRGEYGAVASLREVWTFDEIDRETIDLETLRRYIPQVALEKALRDFIKDGGRTIKGARIYQDYKSFVR